ncbi:MAG: caspase family protein [Leptospiraceae bacterium]|nr:caspase family protein [Leptospiraceae bacterium]
MWKSLILILIISLSLYAQETNPKQTKKYNIKTKGFKLTEIDEEGTPINVGKRYALIIGINDYNDSTISDLSKARNDAKAMGKILKELGQFDQVFVMTDDILKNDSNHLYPTKLNIEEKVESILRFITPEDMIVLYFSGHGISDFDENGYLLTVDTVADKKFTTSLKIDWIVKKFQEKKIKKSLLILDACRDILYTSKSAVRDSIREKVYTEAEVAATFYSTKSGYFSYEDDESDYGVFTKNLIYGMEGKADENGDGVVSFGELQIFVEKAVRQWSLNKNKQQKPYTKIYGERTGDLAITVAAKPPVSLVDKKVEEDISRSPYIWRSAVLPGWGQTKNGNSIRGSVYMISFLGLVVGSYSQHQRYLKSMNSYQDLALPSLLFLSTPANNFGILYMANVAYFNNIDKAIKTHADLSNQMEFGALFIWTISLVDVILSKPISDQSHIYKDTSTSWKADMKTIPTYNRGIESFYSLTLDKKF